MAIREVLDILVVDDNEDDFRIITRYLAKAETCSFALHWADSVEAARRFVAGRAPALCLLDYSLGGQTGLDLLAELRQGGHRFPIVFLTGFGNLQIAVQALEQGVIDYLDKNALSPALLERTLRYAIENHRVREELRKANEELEARVRARTAELERRNQDLERFAYIASHELQLPLKTITEHIERMRERSEAAGEDDLGGYFLSRAYEGARRMSGMIRNVLEYSRVGKHTLPKEEVELGEVMRDVVHDLDAAVQESGAEIAVAGLPTVSGHRGLLYQLLKNLVSNGIKFRGEHAPRLQVWSEAAGHGWRIAVRDNGCGIPPEDLGDIFLMFHRADSQRTVPGDGIGLAFCKRIVEHHGGRIWAESAPGQGATLYFELPKEPAPASGEPAAEEPAPAACGRRSGGMG